MLSVSEQRLLDTELPLISGNYRELLFDEVPILFVGTNKFNGFVIGSSVEEDYENGFERYLHITVERHDYVNFMRRKVPYLELLEKAKPIFVVDKYHADETVKIYHYSFDEIPDDYRPSLDTLCPLSSYQPSYVFSASFFGGEADKHHAPPEDIGEFTNNWAELIGIGTNTLKNYLSVKPNVYVQPATEGSYQINFEVELKEFPSLFVTETECLDYLNEFIKYCLDGLTEEALEITKPDATNLKFDKLYEKAFDLTQKVGSNEDRSQEVKRSLIHDVLTTPDILQSVAKISENYDGIEVSNFQFERVIDLEGNGVEVDVETFPQPLGLIDKQYQDEIEETVFELAALDSSEKETDDQLAEYKIQVFQFNTHKGSGFASLIETEIVDNKPELRIYTVRIKIDKYDRANSYKKFVDSMRRPKAIMVKALATRKNGRPDSLLVENKDEKA